MIDEAGLLQISRTLPTTVVLDDGRVLIVGGGHDTSSASVEDAVGLDPNGSSTIGLMPVEVIRSL